MRPHTAALKALLDGWTENSNIQKADLYTFTLAGGEVLRYSGFQVAVVAPPPPDPAGLVGPSNIFPLGPGINPIRTKVQIGVQVDEAQLEILAGQCDLRSTILPSAAGSCSMGRRSRSTEPS